LTAKQVQLRRDTRSNISAQTPSEGEPAWDLTNAKLWMGDGLTAGGLGVAMDKDVQQGTKTYLAAGGTANAITVSYSPDLGPPVGGQILRIKLTSSITGAATINPNSHGTASIKKKSGGALVDPVSGDCFAGGIYEFQYDGTVWQIMNELDAGGGLISVSQGNLNTSTGSVSKAGGGTHVWSTALFTLPGGQYGFHPQIKSTGTSKAIFNIGGLTFSGVSTATPTIDGASVGSSYITNMTIACSESANTASAQQLYITSSPPFDLGDGHLHGFIFSKVNKAGDIVATYIADVPPWAYNGPTNIRADYVDGRGRKYRRTIKRRSLEEIIDGAAIEHVWQEITQAHKNADIHLIPHPFPGMCHPDHTIILLDPLDDRLPAIMAHHAHGGDGEVPDALHSGKIYANNEFIQNRMSPPGVPVAPLRFKYSRK
jgi:hypothetical protein